MKISTAFSSLTLAVLALNSSAFAEKCNFSVDPGSVQVSWTAFKTMQKVAVNGAFPQVAVKGKLTHQNSMAHLLQQLTAQIEISGPSSIKTGNPGRDQTLFEHFFSHFKKTPTLKGQFLDVKGKEAEGELMLKLSLNEKTKMVPMKYTRDESGTFQATGSIDVLEFGLNDAFDDLHKTCEVLHKGPDGVSKTWPGVDLKIQAKVERKCNS